MNLLAPQAGGRENVVFIRDDYKNYIRTKRTIQMKFADVGNSHICSIIKGTEYFFRLNLCN